MRDFSCTEDGAGPAADTAFAVSGAASAVISAGSDEEGARTATVVNIATALVYAASAAYGVVMTYDCRAAQRAARARRAEEHARQTQRITELEAALVGARCETSSDCRSDRLCHEHRCVTVPPPPSAGANPDALQILEPPASPTDPATSAVETPAPTETVSASP